MFSSYYNSYNGVLACANLVFIFPGSRDLGIIIFFGVGVGVGWGGLLYEFYYIKKIELPPHRSAHDWHLLNKLSYSQHNYHLLPFCSNVSSFLSLS